MRIAPCILALLLLFSAATRVAAQDDATGDSAVDGTGAGAESIEESAAASGPSLAEIFAGGEASVVLWLGDGFVDTTDASADVPCFFCAPASVQKPVAFDRGNFVAVRMTKWGGEASRMPGIAFETGVAGGDAREASVNFLYLAVMPMFRVPLFVTPSTPDGRLNVYAGLGLAVSGGGSATLEDTSLPHSVSGNPRGTGTTTAIGVRWRHGRFIASIERRSLDLGLTFSDFGGGHASLDYDATIYAIGLGRAF